MTLPKVGEYYVVVDESRSHYVDSRGSTPPFCIYNGYKIAETDGSLILAKMGYGEKVFPVTFFRTGLTHVETYGVSTYGDNHKTYRYVCEPNTLGLPELLSRYHRYFNKSLWLHSVNQLISLGYTPTKLEEGFMKNER